MERNSIQSTSYKADQENYLKLITNVVKELHLMYYLCLNVELELALAAIQKCLTLLHGDLGPDTKQL